MSGQQQSSHCHNTSSPLSQCEQSLLENQYTFVNVQQFEQAERGSFLDFIGVVKSAGYPGYVTFKHKRNLLKRDITMVDRANHVAMVKLWGVHARINVSNNPVLVMRGAKVSEYGGRRFLSVIKSSHLEVNPNCGEARELRKWYDDLCHSPRTNSDNSISTIKLVQSESSDLKKRQASNYSSVQGSNECRKRSPNQSDSLRSKKKNVPSGDESEPDTSKEGRAVLEDSLHTEVKRAIDKGAVDVKIIKCVTLGPPEAGKTQLKHALLGDFTPITKSTDASTQATPAVEIMVAGEQKWEPLNFKRLQSAMQTTATKEDLPQWPTNGDTQFDSQNQTQSSNRERIPEDRTAAGIDPSHEDDPLPEYNPLETKISTQPSEATYIDHFRNLKGKVMEAILGCQSSDANINIHGAKLIYTVDSGGQPSFLDFHPVTATFAATYLLLYNMEEGLDAKPKMTYRKDYPTIDLPNSTQSNLEILHRSLFTVHHFKERYHEKHERLTSLMQDKFKPARDDPYIIIVGTRRNEATLKEDKKKLKSEYTRIPSVKGVVKTHFVNSLKCDSKEIEDLRSLVCTDASSCSFRLPLSWFQLHLMCLASESGTVPERIPGNLTFSELRTFCLEEELVSSGSEFKAMVTVFHSLGVFSCPDLDLNEKEVEDSDILVFINPSLLFANVTKILEIPFRKFSKQSLINLQLSGELTTMALEDLGIPDTLGSYQGFHERLLKWLVHWGLAAGMEEEKKWFVPSVLRPRLNPSDSAINKTRFEPFPLSICFLQKSSDDFTFHYLPEGLFPHFIVHLVKIGYILPKNVVEEDPEEDECVPCTRCRDSMSLRSKRNDKPAFNIDLIDKASHLVVDLSPAKEKLSRPEAYRESGAILADLKEAMDKANKNLYHHNSDNVAICCTCTCEFEEDHLAEVQEQRCEICCLHPRRLQQGAWQDDCDESLKEVIKSFHAFSGVKRERKRPPQHDSSSSKRKEPSIDSEESDFSASSRSSEDKTKKRGSKSTKRGRSSSEVTVRDVIRGMTREKLHSGIKKMLTEHRTNLLCDDWELINEECRDDILGDLKANNKTKAADRLIDYFNNNHTGEELLLFCDLLTKEAKKAGRNTQLLKLANAIKEAVHIAS